MEELKSSIVTCEECFNIPKIIILAKDKVKIECSKCNKTEIKDIQYFDKFYKKLEEKQFIDLPKCSFNDKHEVNSIKYCFQCIKYLCEECIKTHNIVFKEKSHILIEQKIENQYYCNIDSHKEFIYDCFCIKCNTYLCPKCKCEHEDEKKYFFNINDKRKINEIIEKVKKCEEIIKNEEKILKSFLMKLNKMIK